MNNFEKIYSNIMSDCLKKGEKIIGRNGKIRQITGAQIRANLLDGFPIVTGKKIYPKSCFIETEWMLNGLTNIKWLNERGVKIWDQWADKNGDLGPIYGHQLLNFNGVNQINNLVNEYKLNKHSRRLICSMWNPSDLSKMSLPPCHYSFQFIVSNDKIDIVVSMRSLDLFIGLPYDIAMYASLLSSFAKEFNLIAREVVINAGNAHVYEEHVKEAAIYIGRDKYDLPKLLNTSNFTNFNANDFELSKYKCWDRLVVNVIK